MRFPFPSFPTVIHPIGRAMCTHVGIRQFLNVAYAFNMPSTLEAIPRYLVDVGPCIRSPPFSHIHTSPSTCQITMCVLWQCYVSMNQSRLVLIPSFLQTSRPTRQLRLLCFPSCSTRSPLTPAHAQPPFRQSLLPLAHAHSSRPPLPPPLARGPSPQVSPSPPPSSWPPLPFYYLESTLYTLHLSTVQYGTVVQYSPCSSSASSWRHV